MTVQLTDLATGVPLWADTYDRDASTDAAFETQDDLVARIVSTCGDHFGVLACGDLAPANHLAFQALAVALCFRRETTACLAAAERAIALNPRNGSNEAFFLLCFTGRWDRGVALIREAIERNPHHPRWYETILGVNEYRQGHYRAAADVLLGLNAPEIFWNNMFIAAACGQLGDLMARQALDTLLSQ
ncbi:hypothetical protein [Gemmatimonas sp.]|uniref:hypothetical protein n=1 Tax=Gemmatimonas sp. TaxID=1962908 RepID=UPI00398324A8